MKWLQSEAAVFLLKLLAFYIIWYIIYDLWLLPDGRLDAWMTYHLAGFAADILQVLHYDVFWKGRLIGIGQASGVWLANGCSGISAIGLFAGLILAYPSRWVSGFFYILFGAVIICLLNVLRIITLAITQVKWPRLFDFTHHYSTTVVFYLIIFGLWMLWFKMNEYPLRRIASSRRTIV